MRWICLPSAKLVCPENGMVLAPEIHNGKIVNVVMFGPADCEGYSFGKIDGAALHNYLRKEAVEVEAPYSPLNNENVSESDKF